MHCPSNTKLISDDDYLTPTENFLSTKALLNNWDLGWVVQKWHPFLEALSLYNLSGHSMTNSWPSCKIIWSINKIDVVWWRTHSVWEINWKQGWLVLNISLTLCLLRLHGCEIITSASVPFRIMLRFGHLFESDVQNILNFGESQLFRSAIVGKKFSQGVRQSWSDLRLESHYFFVGNIGFKLSSLRSSSCDATCDLISKSFWSQAALL